MSFFFQLPLYIWPFKGKKSKDEKENKEKENKEKENKEKKELSINCQHNICCQHPLIETKNDERNNIEEMDVVEYIDILSEYLIDTIQKKLPFPCSFPFLFSIVMAPGGRDPWLDKINAILFSSYSSPSYSSPSFSSPSYSSPSYSSPSYSQIPYQRMGSLSTNISHCLFIKKENIYLKDRIYKISTTDPWSITHCLTTYFPSYTSAILNLFWNKDKGIFQTLMDEDEDELKRENKKEEKENKKETWNDTLLELGIEWQSDLNAVLLSIANQLQVWKQIESPPLINFISIRNKWQEYSRGAFTLITNKSNILLVNKERELINIEKVERVEKVEYLSLKCSLPLSLYKKIPHCIHYNMDEENQVTSWYVQQVQQHVQYKDMILSDDNDDRDESRNENEEKEIKEEYRNITLWITLYNEKKDKKDKTDKKDKKEREIKDYFPTLSLKEMDQLKFITWEKGNSYQNETWYTLLKKVELNAKDYFFSLEEEKEKERKWKEKILNSYTFVQPCSFS